MIGNQVVKIVEGLAPIDIVSAAHTGNHVSLKGYSHLTIIINTGAWAGGNAAITLDQSTVVAGTDDKTLGFDFMYTNDGATTTDTLTKTAVTSDTFNADSRLLALFLMASTNVLNLTMLFFSHTILL